MSIATQLPSSSSPGRQRTRRVNAYAIVSLILGLLWLFGLASVLAVVFGCMSLGEIPKRRERGRGIAIAGILLGLAGVVVAVIGTLWLRAQVAGLSGM
jgi:hypothetical protein